jgi:hypothetical protein
VKRYYVGFMFSTFVEAESKEAAIRQAEKAMSENGYAVHCQRVDGTLEEILREEQEEA